MAPPVALKNIIRSNNETYIADLDNFPRLLIWNEYLEFGFLSSKITRYKRPTRITNGWELDPSCFRYGTGLSTIDDVSIESIR